MCGIIATLSKKKCLDILLDGLEQLQNRGYDSAGLSTLTNNNIENLKFASSNEESAINKLKNNIFKIKDSTTGIAHTRWATHGPKTDVNSHPHISYDNKLSLVHNGIIENFLEIRNRLEHKGIQFKSQTDTEVIVNLLAYEYSIHKNFIVSLNKCIEQLEGTWGLCILNVDEPETIYCVRHGSPLLVSESDDYIMVSSEQSGFCGLMTNYIVLESNDICIINNNGISTSNKYIPKDTQFNNFDLTPYPYSHWTLKEIEEQYESSLRAISLGGRLLDDNNVKLGGLKSHKEILIRINNIIILGCGTSYHAGLLATHYFKDLCNFNIVLNLDGAEFSEKDIPKFGNTALILLSQSGETVDLLKCIDIGKKNNLFLIGIINVVDSLIARETHCGCYLNAGREVGVASTKSFTSQVIVLSLLAIWFSQIHNTNEIKRYEYMSCLRQLPYHIKETINTSKKYKDKILKIINKDNLFLLGRGKSEAIAKEGSLKIKEISYIHSEGYPGSSLKHGPFALLCKDFPVIIISPNDEFYDKMLNTYQEIKSRNAPILFISNKQNNSIENLLTIPKNNIYSDLLSIIPLQFAAYYLSLERGFNPDLPRNLAKCVTVE